MYKYPLFPSTIPIWPSTLSSRGTSAPISAGIPIVLASIDVWELTDPFSLTNDNILLLSICTVSEGARSSARTITGSSELIPPFLPPMSILIIRSVISLTSAALPRIYSSSMAENIWKKLSPVCATAYSALTICVSIIFFTDSI